MKGFKEYMQEDGTRGIKSLGGDGGSQNQYGRWGQEPVHVGIHRIENPQALQRLNAHIGLINTREYIDPLSALEHLQNALMRLGYHFEYNMDVTPSEENVYSLRRFGGRQGFIDMDAEIKEDDFIENAVGEKMVLHVEFLQDPSTSRYDVMAQIVPASLFDEEELSQEPVVNRASISSTSGDRDGINVGEEISEARQKFIASFPSKTDRNAAIAAVKAMNPSMQADASALFPGAGPKNGAFFAIRSIDRNPANLLKAIKKHKGTITSKKTEAARIADEVVYEQSLAQKAGLSSKSLSDKIAKIRREDPDITQRAAAGKAVGILAPKAAKRLFAQKQDVIEDISRTFAFPTAAARDRIQALLGMSSRGRVRTSDEKKGKQPFKVTADLKRAQLDRIMQSVSKLKGVTENNAISIADSAIQAIQERDVAKGHQMKIARDTLKMNPVFAKVMGGMTKKEAAEFLMKNGNAKDKKAAKLELQREQMNEVVTGNTEFLKTGKHAGTWQIELTFTDEPLKDIADRTLKNVKKAGLDAELKRDFGRRGVDRVTVWVKLEGPRQSKKEANRKFLSTMRAADAKSIRLEAKDENEKELERTRKDGKLASAFSEAAEFTIVALKGNKVVDQMHSLEKKEIKIAVANMKKNNPGAKISVENQSGRVVSVEGVREQISNDSPAWGY